MKNDEMKNEEQLEKVSGGVPLKNNPKYYKEHNTHPDCGGRITKDPSSGKYKCDGCGEEHDMIDAFFVHHAAITPYYTVGIN